MRKRNRKPRWQTFQESNHQALRRAHHGRPCAVLLEPRLMDGRRPDHAVVCDDGAVVELAESKHVRELTHEHVDQLLGYDCAVGGAARLALFVRSDTNTSADVIARLVENEIDLFADGEYVDLPATLDDDESSPVMARVGTGLAAAGAGWLAGHACARTDATGQRRFNWGAAAIAAVCTGLLLDR